MTPNSSMKYDPRGSMWHRWDMHFHTPSSYDYLNKGISNRQIVDRLVAEGVRVVAITDHHVMDIERIRELQLLGGDSLTVLPGIELRDDHGGKPVHYICIFSEECNLEHVWRTLEGGLGLTQKAVQDKGGDEKIYVPIEKGAELARTLDGVISIHAGEKSNSIDNIKNTEQFQQRIKFDIVKQWVDLMEIGQIKDIDSHLNIVFPSTGLERPLVICSDCHDVSTYSVKVPLWLRADPTFRGLLMAIREPRDRFEIADRPESVIRVEKNPTKYVRSVAFQSRASAPVGEVWFRGEIPINVTFVQSEALDAQK